MNARSLYNKSENAENFLIELGIDVAIVSETWEREELTLESLFNSSQFKVLAVIKLYKINSQGVLCNYI